MLRRGVRECCPGTRSHEADVPGKAEIVGIATARVEVNQQGDAGSLELPVHRCEVGRQRGRIDALVNIASALGRRVRVELAVV